MLRSLITGLLLIFSFPLAYGQQIRTYVNKTQLNVTDELKVYLAVFEGKLTETPDFPEIAGFYKGPDGKLWNTGGQMDERVYLQTYYPKEAGTFEIPSFEVQLVGNVLETGPILVEVENSLVSRTNYIFEPLPLNARLTLEVETRRAYIGQQILADIYLTVKGKDITRIKWEIDQLASLLYQLESDRVRIEPVVVVDEYPESQNLFINDGPYKRYHLLRCAVFPLRTGEISLKPVHIEIQRKWEARNAAPEDIRKGLHSRFQTEMLTTNQVVLEVLELPETKLLRAGSVGQFSIKDSLSKQVYSTGESIFLSIRINGDGNLSAIPQPFIQVPESLLYYDPVSSFAFKTNHKRLSGFKDFVYELIAPYPGNYQLGPVVFYYFNPAETHFDSLKIDRIEIEVKGKEIPQLLEINILDNFYRNALKNSSVIPPTLLPYENYLVIAVGSLAILLLGIALIQWNSTVNIHDQQRKRYTKGYKKIVENRKG